MMAGRELKAARTGAAPDSRPGAAGGRHSDHWTGPTWRSQLRPGPWP